MPLSILRLRTFGGVALKDGDRSLDGPLTQRRRLALLAMLAVAGDAGVSRDKLIAQLWPETDTERARHSLRQWIFLLRRDLGGDDDVLLGTTDLRLNPQLISSDVGDFEQAISAGDDERAASLYEGPFLDGFHLAEAGEFERWMEGQRSRYAARFAEVMERVARVRSAAGDLTGAAGAWRR